MSVATKKKAALVLEDGSVYKGYAFGAARPGFGEVVFNTSMTGYQEMLTDPSYAGQIVMPTYPLMGNYGINERDFESRRVQVSGFVVREPCLAPSHAMSTSTLDEFLAAQGVPGISGVDTRAITRRLRAQGVMMGTIAVDESPEAALARLRNCRRTGTWTTWRVLVQRSRMSGARVVSSPSVPMCKMGTRRPSGASLRNATSNRGRGNFGL